jgi:hypothetical protein
MAHAVIAGLYRLCFFAHPDFGAVLRGTFIPQFQMARWAGHYWVARISRRLGVEANIQKAEALARRWGGLGIFFSCWLVTALGPWLNVTSGIAE